MGKINNKELYPEDPIVTLDDYVIGSNSTDGKTFTYPLRKIVDFVENTSQVIVGNEKTGGIIEGWDLIAEGKPIVAEHGKLLFVYDETSDTVIIKNISSQLTQDQINALNSSYIPSTNNPYITLAALTNYNAIKKINTTILPDVNGNAVVPIATETNDGLMSFGGIQNLKGTKNIKMNGSSSNVIYGFSVTDSAGVSAFRIAENRDSNFLGQLISTGTFQLASGYMQIAGAGTMGAIRKLGALLEFGQNTDQEKRLRINIDTGGTTIGANSGVDTNAMFEVFSIANAKVSVPFSKMTNANRLLIAGANLVEGGGVYVTDAGANKGLWIYEGATIGWKQYAKL